MTRIDVGTYILAYIFYKLRFDSKISENDSLSRFLMLHIYLKTTRSLSVSEISLTSLRL